MGVDAGHVDGGQGRGGHGHKDEGVSGGVDRDREGAGGDSGDGARGCGHGGGGGVMGFTRRNEAGKLIPRDRIGFDQLPHLGDCRVIIII